MARRASIFAIGPKRGDARACQSTQRLVVDTIKEAVRVGRLVPGQRLPEADLIEQLGVGRGSVREALRILAAEGLLDLEHNRGARIRTFTLDEIRHLHQVREALEGLAASLAASSPGRSERETELAAINHACEAAVAAGDTGEWLTLNARFHELIIEMSGNPYLRTSVDRLHVGQFRIFGFGLLTKAFMERSLKDHFAITDAILRGDEAAAERLMREHISKTRLLIMSEPTHFFGPRDRGGG